MNKSFNEAGLQMAWDSTSLKLAETCLRKYQYKMIEGWQPRGLSVHLKFGLHYATALEHFYKHIALGATRDEALELVIHEALIETWDHERDEAGNRLPDTGQRWQSDHATKTRENLIRTLVWYVDQFDDNTIEVVKLSDGKPAVEYSFALPVDDGLIFSGHLDRVVTFSGDAYVMDQKTTGSTITSNYFKGFNPDTQMSMYSFAGRMVYNIAIRGVIIDAASIMVGFTRFERGFTFRTEDQLNEWYDDALATVESAHRATRENHFPLRTVSCGMYGGCEFREICSRSPAVRKNFLAGDFVKAERWDPLKSR